MREMDSKGLIFSGEERPKRILFFQNVGCSSEFELMIFHTGVHTANYSAPTTLKERNASLYAPSR